jgi:hypothetical protein
MCRRGRTGSAGVTCGGLCLRTAKHARKSVPAHSGGVFAFFNFVEKRKHPTPKGSVREPGFLTHLQVIPVEGRTGVAEYFPKRRVSLAKQGDEGTKFP